MSHYTFCLLCYWRAEKTRFFSADLFGIDPAEKFLFDGLQQYPTLF